MDRSDYTYPAMAGILRHHLGTLARRCDDAARRLRSHAGDARVAAADAEEPEAFSHRLAAEHMEARAEDIERYATEAREGLDSAQREAEAYDAERRGVQ